MSHTDYNKGSYQPPVYDATTPYPPPGQGNPYGAPAQGHQQQYQSPSYPQDNGYYQQPSPSASSANHQGQYYPPQQNPYGQQPSQPYQNYGSNDGYQPVGSNDGDANSNDLLLAEHRERFSDFDPSRFEGPHEEIIIYKTDDDSKRWRDWGCAVFFLLQLVGVLGVSIYGISKIDFNTGSAGTNFPIYWGIAGKILACTLLSTATFSTLWLALIRKHSDCVIVTSILFNVLLLAAAGAISMAIGAIGGGVVFFVLVLFTLLYLFCIRHRIAFTREMIKASVTGLLKYPGVFAVSFLTFFVSIAFSIAIFFGFVNVLLEAELSNEAYYACAIGVFFVMAWNLEVFANINHVTTAGVIGTWWYLPNNNSASASSLRRACTTSLGSIALGSLLVALIQTLRAIIRASANGLGRNGGNGGNRGQGFAVLLAICCLCILYCFAACLERFIRFFNIYAYSQVGLYGKDYVTAARDTFDLFISKGFSALINDDLTHMVVGMGCSISTILSLIGAGLILYYQDDGQFDDNFIVLMIYFAFIIGFWGASVMFRPVRSAVITTFVVYAEDPQALQENRPNEFEAINNARRKFYM